METLMKYFEWRNNTPTAINVPKIRISEFRRECGWSRDLNDFMQGLKNRTSSAWEVLEIIFDNQKFRIKAWKGLSQRGPIYLFIRSSISSHTSARSRPMTHPTRQYILPNKLDTTSIKSVTRDGPNGDNKVCVEKGRDSNFALSLSRMKEQ